MSGVMENERDESEFIARKIIKYIESESIGVGEKLPSIRKFAEMWGARQNVVRDALVRVQTMGVVTVLPRAGAFVCSLDFSPMVDALADTFHTSLVQEDVNLLHLISARKTLEIELAGQAAANRRPEDMFPLHQALQNVSAVREDRARFLEADERFHLEIARLTGNPVFVVMLRSLLTLLRPHRMDMMPPDLAPKGRSLHDDIYRAILNGDATRARELMLAHLETQVLQVMARLSESPRETAPTSAD